MSAEAIFEALGELDEGLIREGREIPHGNRRPRKMLLLAAVVALLALLLAASTLALGMGPVNRYRTARGDEIMALPDGGVNFYESAEENCFVRDGRILMVLDGVERDITDKCSDTKYYAWEHTYEGGLRLLVVAGGTPERMGWFWVYFFPENDRRNGRATFMLPSFYDYASAPWAAQAERDYGLEFMHLTDKPDYGDLTVPTASELIEHGYPVNERGETYGPTGYETWLGQPDLVLALGKNGIHGYLRWSEVEEVTGGNVRTPEEAIAWNEYVKERGPVEIPVYREDGETVVDWFVIG